MFLNDTWKMLVDNDAYGSVVKSAMFRLVGKGKSCLEWSANLEKEGIYDRNKMLWMWRHHSKR